MRTFEVTAPGGAKLEGVIFGDGSIAVRRRDDDPTERFTQTFEGRGECEEELGIRVPWPGRSHYAPEPNEPEPEASS